MKKLNANDSIPEYRRVLSEELVRRKKNNASYSLRAMARDLEVSSSFLSHIINASRKLSLATALKIVDRLRLSPQDRKNFISATLEVSGGPQQAAVEIEQLKGIPFVQLTDKEFKILSHWYYFAIIELTELANFQSDPNWIAKKLSISLNKTNVAINHLEKIGLLEINGQNILKKKYRNYLYEEALTEEQQNILNRSNRQFIQLAERSIENQAVANRDISGVTMAIDISKLPETKRLIKNFKRHLMDLVKTDSTTALYRLNIQFFRLDQL